MATIEQCEAFAVAVETLARRLMDEPTAAHASALVALCETTGPTLTGAQLATIRGQAHAIAAAAQDYALARLDSWDAGDRLRREVGRLQIAVIAHRTGGDAAPDEAP